MRYVPALDGLRAFAVILTILLHAHVPYFAGGYLGVDIFFVLSGFLITGLLLGEMRDTGGIRFVHFYIRRALRLYPALLLLLVIVCLPLFPQPELLKTTVVTALYLTDYALAYGYIPDSLLNHTWSLAVEEHFYILWPPLLLWLHRRYPDKRLVAILGAVFVAAAVWKVACIADQSWREVFYRFDTRMSGLWLGSFLAAARFHGVKIPFADDGLVISSAALFFCVTYGHTTATDHIYFTVVGELFAAFVILRIMDERPWLPARWLSAKVPVLIGRLSYGLYLFHYPFTMLWYIGAWFNDNWFLWLAATVVICFPLAYISHATIEAAARKLSAGYRRASAGQG